MPRARPTTADALHQQGSAVVAWLEDLSDVAYAAPSVLAGWDVRTLVAHLLVVHQGLLAAVTAPSAGPAIPVHELVRRYRPAAGAMSAAAVAAAGTRTGPELVLDLAEDVERVRVSLAASGLPTVVTTPRGPGLLTDFVATRVVELVVHADDLARSVSPDGPPPMARPALAVACRTLARILEAQHPGRSVEVRVPPYAAVQCGIGDPGPTHTRGTPPNVVETDPLSFVRLATGRLTWAEAAAGGVVRASGLRADLSAALPLLS